MNEGHAGFLGLERIRSLIAEHGLTFAEALSAVRAGTVFTTHTPVPGRHRPVPGRPGPALPRPGPGRDVPAAARAGRRRGARARLRGRPQPVQHGAHGPAARAAGQRGGQAARRGVPAACSPRCTRASSPDEVPIGSVTNGVHLPTWAAREMYDVAGDMADWQDLASAVGVAGRRTRCRPSGCGSCGSTLRQPAGRDGQGDGPQVLPAARRRPSPSSAGPSRSSTRTC